MRLLIVHLSDIHLRVGDNPALKYARHFKAVLNRHTGADACLLAYVGDVAFSGKAEEYTIASQLCNILLVQAGQALGCPIYEAFAPGNHDVNFEHERPSRASAINDLLNSYASRPFEETLALLNECCDPQAQYWNFVESRSAHPKRLLDPSRIANIFLLSPTLSVAVSYLNTAALSRLNEHQGDLLLPPQAIPRRPNSCELHIALMHHPLNWLEPWNARESAKVIAAETDLILTGHEHLSAAYFVQELSRPGVVYLHGAVLQDESAESEFVVLDVDLGSRELKAYAYRWNGEGFEPSSEVASHTLASPSARSARLMASEAFEKDYLTDPGAALVHPCGRRLQFDDIYVEPFLTERILTNKGYLADPLFTSLDRIVTDLPTKPRVLLQGSERTGKGALLKRAWRILHEKGMKPLLIRVDQKGSRLTERDVTAAIEYQYGQNASQHYWAVDRDHRICLLDNLQLLAESREAFDASMDLLSQRFGALICTASDTFVVDEYVRGPKRISKIETFRLCTVHPLGYKQRGLLVERWFSLYGGIEERERQKQINYCEALITSLLADDSIPSLPLFVLSLLQSVDSTGGQTGAVGAYAYHYETLIRNAIHRGLSVKRPRGGPITREIVEVLAGHIANELHVNETITVSVSELDDMIVDFKHRELHAFSVADITEALFVSEILVLTDEGVRFRYSYVFQYFIAKHLSIGLGRSSDRAQCRAVVATMLDSLQSEHYANILMLLLYMSPDGDLVHDLASRARRLYASVRPCNCAGDINFAFRNVPIGNLPLPSGSHELNREQMRDEHDKDSQDRELARIVLDDVGVSGAILELNRAIKTLEVLGQVLRNFPASLDAKARIELVKQAFFLGMRTLGFFIQLVHISEEDAKNHAQRIAGVSDRPSQLSLDETGERLMASLVFLGSYGVVKRISRAIGAEHLQVVFSKTDTGEFRVSRKLVEFAIQMEQLGRFPADEIRAFAQEADKAKNVGAWYLLKQLTWDHMFLFPVDINKRKSLSATFRFDKQDTRLMGLPGAMAPSRRKRSDPIPKEPG